MNNIADDGSRGPEWQAMQERHEREGITYWHVDRAPGATDEEVAEALNRVAAHLAIPENNVASRLGGEAALLRDDAHCALRKFNAETMEWIEPSKMERARAEGKLRLAGLLDEAAALLRSHAPERNEP